MKNILSIVLLSAMIASPLNAKEPDALVNSQSLTLEFASKVAWAAIKDCQKRGFSVAVAVVDRGGNLQAFLRDRFAGPHTMETAFRKAWTANSFRQSTSELAFLLQKGVIPDQVQHNPGVLLVGGGNLINATGAVIGAVGVSGAPPGKTEEDSIDQACAMAGIQSIEEDLVFSQ